MPVTTSDTALIRQVQSGQAAAFGILVARYQQYVFTLVLRYVPRRDEAEEIAQDVFIKAYKNLGRFRQESRFSTWLYTIVHTTCLSHLRKKKEPVLALEEDRLISLSDQYPPAGGTTASEQQSRRGLIESAMKRLAPEDAELLTLYYQAEQSLEEISVITGLSAGNVKVKLHRCRQKLKAIFEHYYPSEIVHLRSV